MTPTRKHSLRKRSKCSRPPPFRGRYVAAARLRPNIDPIPLASGVSGLRRGLLLLLGERLRLALCLLLEGRLVVGRAGFLRDLAHHRPGLLVGDREEAVVAVELLGHLGRKAEGEEAGLELL